MTDLTTIEAYRRKLAEKNGVTLDGQLLDKQEGVGEQTPERRFKLRPVSELLSQPSRVNWVIQDYLQAGTVVVLFGESQAGKSLVAIDWAARCAAGIDWQGKKVKQGAVVYIAGEGHAGLPQRLKAWEQHFGTKIPDTLTVSNIGAQFLNAESMAEVMESLEQLEKPPIIVFVDTLAANFGAGNENDTKDMVAFLEGIRRIHELFPDAVIVLIHHPGHADKTRARGAYALKGAVDTEYRLSVTDGLRELSCTKAKDFEPPATRYLDLVPVILPWIDEYGSPISSPVLVETEEKPESRAQLSPQQQKFYKLLREYIDMQKTYLPDEIVRRTKTPPKGGQWVCPPTGFKDYVVSRGGLASGQGEGTPEAEKKAFRRCREALENKGLLHQFDGYMWLGDKGDIAGDSLNVP